MKRGDIVIVRFPHPSGSRGKKRPAVVVQSDAYAGTVVSIIVAEVTTNLTMANDPACLLIVANTPDGKSTGLVRDSVISCLMLVSVYRDRADQVIGSLSPRLRLMLDNCLKAALELP